MTFAFDIMSDAEELLSGGAGTSRFYTSSAIVLVVTVGVSLGVLLPNETNVPQPWAVISAIVGWSFTVTWSISFYPQIFVNFQRKSVVGLSSDFVLLNFMGFLAYVLYTCTLYANEDVREMYRKRHEGQGNGVRINDVVFALHACAATLVTIVQCFIYESGSQKLSHTCMAIAATIVAGCGGLFAAAQSSMISRVETLDFMYVVGWIKVLITFFKYAPQVLMNWRRKSTDGFSIGPILCDITGSGLAFAQQALDAIALRDLSIITGNSVKLGISAVSMVYDVILMVQHYVLYPEVHGAVLPRQREGFKALATYDPADEPAEQPGGRTSLNDAVTRAQHRTLIVDGAH